MEDLFAERYGIMPWDMAKLHPNEIQRLLKGAEIRQEKKQRAAKRGSTPSQNQRQREQKALEKFK